MSEQATQKLSLKEKFDLVRGCAEDVVAKIEATSMHEEDKKASISEIEGAISIAKKNPSGLSLTMATKTVTSNDRAVEHTLKTEAKGRQLEKNVIEKEIELREAHRREEKAHDLARIDELTGLPNKAGFLDNAKTTYARYKREDVNSMSIFVIDGNGVKGVNDTYGHDVGDKLIQTYANILKDVVRDTDIVSRFGGDEFTIVSTGENPERLREKIYEAMKGASFYIEETGEHINLSAAVGYKKANGEDGNYENIFKEADADMYREKTRMKAEIAANLNNPTSEPS